jgi:hypothetical protein
MNDTIKLNVIHNLSYLDPPTYFIKPRKRKTKEEIEFFLKKIKYQEIDLTCYEKLDVIKEDVIKEDVIKKYIIPYDNEPPLPVNHCCHCYEYIYVGSQLCKKLYCQYESLDKESLFNIKINNLKVCPCYTDPINEYYELYHEKIYNYFKKYNLLEYLN